jgi:hypothetical protein
MQSLKEITDANAIDHFMLFCSLDSWGKQAEYIRNGMDFEILNKNVNDFLANGKKHSLTFIVTFNVLSYTRFFDYLKNILLMRQQYNTNRQLIWFDVPQLQYPDWLNAKMIPDMVTELEKVKKFMELNKETIKTAFKGFKDYEISKVQRLIDWIKSPVEFDKTTAMKNFYLFYKEYDKRNDTEFLEYFPELENFWNECKETHE